MNPHTLILTSEQSAVFRESGWRFAVGVFLPESRGKLNLFECDEETAIAAGRVAMGTHQAPATTATPGPAILPPHPLDAPGVFRIAAGPELSAALAAAGPHHFIMATPADATAPETAQGGFVLHCLPLDRQTAEAAANVALGRASVATPATNKKPAARRKSQPKPAADP